MKAESNARTYARQLPLVPVEGRGAMIKDVSGRWLYDCLAAAGAASLGWNHPIICDTIQSLMASSAPLLTLDFDTPLLAGFVEELSRSLPEQLADDCVVHLCGPSGTNAVEAALAAAEEATGGDEHVAMEGGFHGCTRGARSVSSGAGIRHTGASDRRAFFLPFPQDYRCPFGVGGEQSTQLAQRAAQRLLFHPHSPLTHPASVIVECVQGEAGTVPAPREFVRTLRDCSERRGIPLIADEVQAGMYRTGMPWAFMHSGVAPDAIVMSKGLGAGVPIAVVVLRRSLNVWRPGAFTGTFRGNSMAFAVATATLRFAREQDLATQVRARGEQLLAGLRRIESRASTLGEVRGLGLMLGAEIVERDGADARGVRRPDPQAARRLQRACFEQGLLVEVGGAHANVIRFLPPLTVTADEVDGVLECFEQAVRRAEDEKQ